MFVNDCLPLVWMRYVNRFWLISLSSLPLYKSLAHDFDAGYIPDIVIIFPGFLVAEVDSDDAGQSFFDQLVHSLLGRRQQSPAVEHFRTDGKGGGGMRNFDFDPVIGQQSQREFSAVIGRKSVFLSFHDKVADETLE